MSIMFNEGKYMFQKFICVCVLISVAFVVPNEASAKGLSWKKFKRGVNKIAKHKVTKWGTRGLLPFSLPLTPITEKKAYDKTWKKIKQIAGGVEFKEVDAEVCPGEPRDENGRCHCPSGKPRRPDGKCPPFLQSKLDYPQYAP